MCVEGGVVPVASDAADFCVVSGVRDSGNGI
jgi:hypothetical protein